MDRITFPGFALATAALLIVWPAVAQTTTPITLVSVTGIASEAPIVRPVSIRGTGSVSPFGSAAVSFIGNQDQISGLTQGTFVIALNRIDSFNIMGSPQVVGNVTNLTLPGSITGGTGAFSGASGAVTFTFKYTAKDSSSGTFSLAGSGNITVGKTTTAITLAGFSGPGAVTNAVSGTLQASPLGSVAPFGTATVNFNGSGTSSHGTNGPVQGAFTFVFNANDSFVASFAGVFNLFADPATSLACTITGGTGIFSGATGSLAASFGLNSNGTFALTGTGKITQPAAGTSRITSVTTANGDSQIAQNTFIVIKGNNLIPANTPASGVTWSSAPSFASGQMPTQLGGVSVTVNGKPAFLYFYCSAATDTACAQDQLNILTPLDNTIGPVPVVINSGPIAIPPFFANMQTVAPSFLLFDTTGHVAATHLDYTLVGPVTLYPGSSTPAKPGDTIVLFAVGFGLPATPLINGSSSQSGSLSVFPVCQVGGTAVALGFAGIVSPGLYQLNLNVPSSAANGENAVDCTYNGSTTPPGNLITVMR
jgi:uncharacterized protein (TIGR03437 family)